MQCLKPVALVVFVALLLPQATNTQAGLLVWDANPSVASPGPNDGSGNWATDGQNLNWWNGSQNVPWNPGDLAVLGVNTASAATVNVDPARSPGPLDLQQVIDYGGSNGVGVILYVNKLALANQIDILPVLYRSWGVKGIKFGFVNVGSQTDTSWLHDSIRKCATNQIMADVHDEYRMTGYPRTYPNFMTAEGISGDETTPTPGQDTTLLFTRMLAGAADHTVCYFDARVANNWTHAYQLAKAVCFYSPWQFLFWYDRPANSPVFSGSPPIIGDEPELEFYDALPTVWDDTRCPTLYWREALRRDPLDSRCNNAMGL